MNEGTNTRQDAAQTPGRFRPRLSLYHANAKGTGGALRMELHPAHDNTDGCIMTQVASQMTVGDIKGPNPIYPRFNWDGSICVKLDFQDLTRMLQVFRGECESLEDGHGLVHVSPRGTTKIVLRHLLEPRSGYSFEVYRNSSGGESNARVFLSANEALGIAAAIEGSMSVICFGIPMLVKHDTSAYRAETREMRNASAA